MHQFLTLYHSYLISTQTIHSLSFIASALWYVFIHPGLNFFVYFLCFFFHFPIFLYQLIFVYFLLVIIYLTVPLHIVYPLHFHYIYFRPLFLFPPDKITFQINSYSIRINSITKTWSYDHLPSTIWNNLHEILFWFMHALSDFNVACIFRACRSIHLILIIE